ncbi:hypothetical protein C8F01DRAFT_1166947 [Mycena amicta]|nr:hypothetical protein C8F01DRAFT_1166947 [Mycena amicta]
MLTETFNIQYTPRSHETPPLPGSLPTSPCPELLFNNEEPNDTQLSELGFVLRRVDVEMDRVQREIASLSPKGSDMARDLLSYEQQLRDFKESHRRVASAIRTLPNDILLEIFLQLKPEFQETCSAQNQLFRVLAVCRRWRNLLLLSAPLLWSKIHVCLERGGTNLRIIDDLKWRMSVHLRCSQPLPLTIDLTLPSGHPASVSLLDLLLTEAPRWQGVSLCIDTIHYSSLGAFPQTFPSLTRLSLRLKESGFPSGAYEFFGRLPALVHLRIKLSARGVRWEAFGSDIWPRLQSCYLEQCSVRDALTLLPRFSTQSRVTFVYCSADNLNPDTTSFTPNHPPLHISISELGLKNCDARFAVELFHAIAAPHLQKLSIGGVNDYTSMRSQVLPSIFALLQRSSDSEAPTLTHLRLLNPGLSPKEFTAGLLSLLTAPSARRIVDLDLDLRQFNSPAEILHALASPGPLVPELRWLSLRGCKYVEGADIGACC